MKKRCSTCKTEKNITEFYKDITKKDGLRNYCKPCSSKYCLTYQKHNKKHISEIKYDREYHREYIKKWKLENKGKVRKYHNEYNKKRAEKDPHFKINARISSAIGMSLKGNKNGHHWEDIVGFTLNDLIKHLKKNFHPGMTLDNYGEWHLDHRVPKSVFNFSDPSHIDFKRCWALSNLQPLWAFDNLSKNDSREGHFQPSLELAL